MSEERTNGKRPRYTRHDKRGTEAFKKNMDCVSAKMAVSKKQVSINFIFQLTCFYSRPCAIFFNCRSVAFGVTCVRRPEQLVRSTPLLCKPEARGLSARRQVCSGADSCVGVTSTGDVPSRLLPTLLRWQLCIFLLY